jgi:hypothetical protein
MLKRTNGWQNRCSVSRLIVMPRGLEVPYKHEMLSAPNAIGIIADANEVLRVETSAFDFSDAVSQ